MAFKRPDGRIGIRNHLEILYTVECAHTVASRIAGMFKEAQVLGFTGCLFNQKSYNQMIAVGTHPNAGAVLIVSLGCEGTNGEELKKEIQKSGKPVERLVIQECGGTLKTIEKGVVVAQQLIDYLGEADVVDISPADLIVGIECGGSDATSGIAANPAAGAAADHLISSGGTILIEEITELLGCRGALAKRAHNTNISQSVIETIEKARRFSIEVGSFTISPGNNAGGLSTIEEKSLGALAKAGTSPIQGVIELGSSPTGQGLYLIDTLSDPDAKQKCLCSGGDVAGNISLIASGAHMIVFTTGKGNVIGAPIVPVIKVCGNPITFANMTDNMDINAGLIISDEASITEIGEIIYREILAVAGGKRTKAETLEHHEFFIPYRY